MAMKISCLVNPSRRHWAYLTRPPLQYTFPKMVLYIAFSSSWAPFWSNKVNKLFSNHMVQWLFLWPHTIFLSSRLRNQSKESFQARGVKLSFMPLFIKATSIALLHFPVLNSSVDAECENLTFKVSCVVKMLLGRWEVIHFQIIQWKPTLLQTNTWTTLAIFRVLNWPFVCIYFSGFPQYWCCHGYSARLISAKY